MDNLNITVEYNRKILGVNFFVIWETETSNLTIGPTWSLLKLTPFLLKGKLIF